MKTRVVITGMNGISPMGTGWKDTKKQFLSYTNTTRVQDEWDKFTRLETRLACPVLDFKCDYPRSKSRSMGRISKMAVRATELALEEAKLLDTPLLHEGRMGIAYGSSTGSPTAVGPFAEMRINGNMNKISPTTYIQMMSHTCAVNIALMFEIKGRVIPTCSACTSGSQAIGYAYESILNGHQDIMVAGGAEELCVTEAAVFDVLYATSTKNNHPETTPNPFSNDRDGLVIGEGAGTLILEKLEHAQKRNATIYAEVVGFGTNCDGGHITQPDEVVIAKCMNLALESAQLKPSDIGYVNAHATGTLAGDRAESQATAKVMGRIPVSSFKSYMGHTLGASGALESWMSIQMMNEGWFAPTLNLHDVDPECGDLNYIKSKSISLGTDYVMNNNFAFGGINTSLIFKKWKG